MILYLTGKVYTMKKSHNISEVRIAYPFDGVEDTKLDPASIEIINQSLVLGNIYSRLVEYDYNGNLQAGLAKKFYWQDDNTLVFEFDKKAKSLDGHYINAEDAAFSIKRLLKLGTSTHSDLNFFLCNTNKLNSPSDDCDAVYVKENKLFLKLQNRLHKPYILTSLASGDYAIVPKAAIDPVTLKIINKKITSGPYYIDSISPEMWILKKNENHYALLEQTPEKVILVSTAKASAFDLFTDNKVDIIPTLQTISSKKLDEVKDKVENISIEKTLDIKLIFLQFSPAAQKRTTREQRASVARSFENEMTNGEFRLPLFAQQTYSFFQDQSLGKLNSKQEQKLKSYLSSDGEFSKTKPITFYMYKGAVAFEVFRKIKEIDPIVTENNPFKTPLAERLELFLATTDTSFEGNLTLLAYNFNMGTFGLTKEEGSAWIDKYLNITDQKKQAEMIQELQYKALMDGVIFPLFRAPYTSLGRNGFSLPLSPLYASSHFWKIKRQ